jgi:hypothetical protein
VSHDQKQKVINWYPGGKPVENKRLSQEEVLGEGSRQLICWNGISSKMFGPNIKFILPKPTSTLEISD